MMHALVIGKPGTGKSTLIRRVLKVCGRPVYGFETKKGQPLEDQPLVAPVYIYEALHEPKQTEENLVGYCKTNCFEARAESFNRFSSKLREGISPDGIILMDELGFMEAQAQEFCSAIFACLDDEIPVIAAVKPNEIPFLQDIRSHPKARCFYLTEDTRDEVYEQVLKFMQEQLNASHASSQNEL